MNDLEANANAPSADLPALVIPLLKGVIYRDAEPRQWQALLLLQARVNEAWGHVFSFAFTVKT